MIKKIKSSFFTRLLFFHLSEEIKLKIVKYNKLLQNKIDINLNNYKLFKGRYIIYKEDGTVNEYDSFNGQLIYEGEYLNDKRNGKGREYYPNGKLKFEGEYLNGKRTGNGKKYDKVYEFLNYDGEYLNGKKNGKGREYRKKYFSNLIFEGEYINGQKWNGKGYYKNYLIYELKNGKGYVKEYYMFDGKLIYEGQYINGEKNGKGREYINGQLLYEG